MLNSNSWDRIISCAKSNIARLALEKPLLESPYAGIVGMQRNEHQTQNMNNLPALHSTSTASNGIRRVLQACAHE